MQSTITHQPRPQPLPVANSTFIAIATLLFIALQVLLGWYVFAHLDSEPWMAWALVLIIIPATIGCATMVAFLLTFAATRLPFGPAPFCLIIISLATGGWLYFNPPDSTQADLRLWTFVQTHYDGYVKIIPDFESRHTVTDEDGEPSNVRVAAQHVHQNAVTRKLRAAFRAGLDVPDLVEVENSRAGTFFRGPVDEIPFIDLKPLLKQTKNAQGVSLYDRMVKNRFALYEHKGRLFGLPHDVHPCMIAYRRDIFLENRDAILEATGIDIEKDELDTWDKFIAVGKVLTRLEGRTPRYMIEISDRSIATFEPFLYQNGGDFFDAEGNLTIDSDVALQTLVWMIPLVAGDASERIAVHGGGNPAFYRNVADGRILSYICPDWRSGSTQFNLPGMEGKMALMPMPAFEKGGRRTSTWGGTMLGITKQKDRSPELAWKLAQHLYFSEELFATQFRETNIIPPFKDAWDHPVINEPRVYWSGQRIGRMYADLADDVPPRNGSPFLQLAKDKVGEVIVACADYYRKQGKEGFREFAKARLDAAAEYVKKHMRRNPF